MIIPTDKNAVNSYTFSIWITNNGGGITKFRVSTDVMTLYVGCPNSGGFGTPTWTHSVSNPHTISSGYSYNSGTDKYEWTFPEPTSDPTYCGPTSFTLANFNSAVGSLSGKVLSINRNYAYTSFTFRIVSGHTL